MKSGKLTLDEQTHQQMAVQNECSQKLEYLMLRFDSISLRFHFIDYSYNSKILLEHLYRECTLIKLKLALVLLKFIKFTSDNAFIASLAML